MTKSWKIQLRFVNLGLALLTIAAIACLASAVTRYRRTAESTQQGPFLAPQTAVALKRNFQHYQIIVSNNPFDPESRNDGKVDSGQRVNPVASASPINLSDLVLLGTVVSEESSFAVIRMGGKSEIFRLNENVPGVGKMEKIQRKQITLQKDGGPPLVLEISASSSQGLHAFEPSSFLPGTALGKPEITNPEITSLGGNRWRISNPEHEKAGTEFDQLAKEAFDGPPISHQGIKGFLIRRLKPSSVLRQIGLQPGDLIQDVNGIPTDSPEKSGLASRQFAGATKVTFVLIRRGEKLTIEYEVE